jgi:hypothetical protein
MAEDALVCMKEKYFPVRSNKEKNFKISVHRRRGIIETRMKTMEVVKVIF